MVHTELTRADAARRDRLDRERPTFDAEAYESGNVIERSCNVLKQWRGLATRYDRLARPDLPRRLRAESRHAVTR